MRLYLFIAYRACYTDYSYIEKRKEKRNVEKKKSMEEKDENIFFVIIHHLIRDGYRELVIS